MREQSAGVIGKKITRAGGNTKALDLHQLAGRKVVSMRTFGKQFLIELPDRAIRIHFLLYGSYRIPRCDIKYAKAVLGRAKRRSFYCARCQKRYS